MIKDYELNKLYTDANGKVSGIFAYNKPPGITSHDVVDLFRKRFNTRKVGHAGALDPFASGVLVILVGKATVLANELLELDKEYVAEVLLGVKTDSGDPEGLLLEVDPSIKAITEEDFHRALKSFEPGYEQHVPVYSSVKVEGAKLRELARRSDKFKIVQRSSEHFAEFYKNGNLTKSVKIPKKRVELYDLEVKSTREVGAFQVITLRVRCSKGTYIRQLAVDLGERLGVPSVLIALQRTKIGDFSLEKCVE